ncbi:MAG TPA: c-type cytochrome [Pseudolabrys sp.]
MRLLHKHSTVLVVCLALSSATTSTASSIAAESLDWAYPVTPPPKPADNTTMRRLPDSTKEYTQAQINDLHNPPDWYPSMHPPMPQVVAHGGPKPAGFACAACHLPSGDGHPESSGLAGLPAAYIVQQMEAFKRGDRTGVRAGVMVAIAKALPASDVKAAADYFSSLRPTVGFNKIIESGTVPVSYVGAGGMRFSQGGDAREPIGQRIIVLPKDAARAAAKDPRSGFFDYVPIGSIAKGKALATGGDSKSPACATCHGLNLKGLGEVPGIGGRTATYIFRQLSDIKRGSRKGATVALMEPVVASLSEDDMISLAAYLESQDP